MKTIRSLFLFLLAFLQNSCGRDLDLQQRQELTADSIVQSYEVQIFATASGVVSYVAKARLSTEEKYGSRVLTPDAEDTLSLNGVTLTWSQEQKEYRASGSGNPGTFTFVWTHEGRTYSNTVTAAAFGPSSYPRTLSKTNGYTVPMKPVPEAVTVYAQLNAGTVVSAPYFTIPTSLDEKNEEGMEETESQLTRMDNGPGVLTIIESQSEDLEAATAAGGSKTVTVQFAYHVIIED